jgi:hypothetical protein
MDYNLVDLVAKILQVTTYMSLGGLIAMVFFFVFSPHILGISRLQHQLAAMEKASRDTNRLLASIDVQLKIMSGARPENPEEPKSDSENQKP